MKILLYSSYYYPYISGITVYTKRLVKELVKKHTATVLTFPFQNNEKQLEVIDGARVVRMPYLFRLSKGFISPQSLLHFWREGKKSDVIFLNIPNVEGLPLALLAKLFHKPIVAIFHCEVILGSTLIAKAIQLVLNVAVFIQLLLADQISMLPGYGEQAKLAKLFRKKITVIPPPVVQLPISHKKVLQLYKEKEDSIWIGFVGRIAREKGIEYLIDAAERLVKQGMDIRLRFAGPSGKEVAGEREYYNAVRALLEEKKVPYDLAGFLSEEALGTFYKTLDVLVLPSVNKTEAFGIVQVEAMLAGTPVVASNMPGVCVPIQMTGMGELFKPGNGEDLAEKIQKVLKNRKHYIKSTTQIVTLFSAKEVVTLYERILKKVLS